MRNAGLDILRFIAVFLVLGRHLQVCPSTQSRVWHDISTVWHRGGWVGVDLFFVLSGYLISGLLFKELIQYGTIKPGLFLIRRGFKIYPPFWVFIASTVLFFNLHSINLKKLFVELFFVQNYFWGYWQHTWSLAVEEHFYFGLVFLLFFLTTNSKREGVKSVPYLFFVIAVCCLLFRVLTFFFYAEFNYMKQLYATHLRIDSLMFGVFLSYLNHFHKNLSLFRWPTWCFIVTGVVLLSPAFIFSLETSSFIPVFGVVLFYLGGGCLVLAFSRIKKSGHPIIYVISSLGAASYSIYLWHAMIIEKGTERLFTVVGWGPYMICSIVGALVFGFFMHRIVEVPSLAIRDKVFPARRFQEKPTENDKRV
ncbi:MAG: acyltransferase [Candidatus Omnitrophica bacterium]|nr:acyltransferase [Candidatus Omnitrophota bacterium]